MDDMSQGQDAGGTAIRMAAKDDDEGGGDPLAECIKGCNEKTQKVDEYLSCVKACKQILGIQAGAFGSNRIVIIG